MWVFGNKAGSFWRLASALNLLNHLSTHQTLLFKAKPKVNQWNQVSTLREAEEGKIELGSVSCSHEDSRDKWLVIEVT